MFTFFNSTNQNKKIISGCYLKILEREPDEIGLSHFLNIFNGLKESNKIKEKILIRILKNSEEYKKLRLAKIDNLSRKIIRKCYLKILEREPDEIGLNYHLNIIKNSNGSNHIKKKLLRLLKNSKEFKKISLAKIQDLKPQYIFKGLHNINYLIRPNNALDHAVVKNGIFNKWLCLKLNGLISKDAVIFDIGANAGLLSLPFAKIFVPLGHVYSFDPDSEVVAQMRKNIKLNNFHNIIVKKLALQDNPKINKIILHRRRAVQDSGLRNDGLSTIEDNSTYKIADTTAAVSTIDKFVLEENIEKLEFIKIDTEGSEYKVLRGGEKIIRKFQPIIFYEYQSVTTEQTVSFKNAEMSYKFIKKMGYKQYYKIRNRGTALKEMQRYSKTLPDGDILCFHQSKLPKWL